MAETIRVYIVTYKRNEILNENLASFWSATHNPEAVTVTVLHNHPDVQIDPSNLRPNLRVVPNTTRHPDAWGYLGRDWNWCLLDAFGSWRNPGGLSWAVCAQNDVTWVDGWDTWLTRHHDLDLISQPTGDQCFAITIDGLRAVGFFDERFTTLHFHEQDWFLRAKLALGGRASINDGHTADSMPWHCLDAVITHPTSSYLVLKDDPDQTLHTQKTWAENRAWLGTKWGFDSDVPDVATTLEGYEHAAARPLPDEVDWYPFFWDGADPLACRCLRTAAERP